MPQMGESITEGTVLTWHKAPGDKVDLDETLLEIGTDKVDTDIPSPTEGVLQEILVQEGDTVEVGTPIAIIETESEGVTEDGTEQDEAEGEPEADAGAQRDSEPEEEEIAEPSAEVREGTDGEEDAEISDEEAEPHLDVRPAGEGDVEVVMPKMGESITEGTILTWHKEPGDRIELDEILLEIGTDKVDTDVPSPAAGILRDILVDANETVDVGTPLAIIGTEDEAPSAGDRPEPDGEKRAPAEDEEDRTQGRELEKQPARARAVAGDGSVLEPTPEAPGEIKRKGDDGRFYSPLVRSIAEKEGLTMDELESISGSGREGRVTKADVLRYIEERAQRPLSVPLETKTRPAAREEVERGGYEGRVEIVKMDRMRQIIAEHMVESKATSAHVTSFTEADVTGLMRLRERNKVSFQEREGVKLAFTPFFVRAAVEALREHPILNSSVEEDKIVVRKDLHIGIAVAIGKTGLVAPVIRSAGQMSLAGLAHAAADLAERARNKKLQPDELQGGTFTLTNIGSLGSLMGTPIINQPQVAILAIGAIKKRPVVIEDPDLGDIIAVRHMLYLSLSYDHRIIDGAMAASFLQRFVRALEETDPDEEL